MKTCPECDESRRFPDEQTCCDVHGLLLIKSEELEPGTIIGGKYRIERLLGRGGMGHVYLATDMLLDQRRALKFLSARVASDHSFVKRFLREARAAVRVDHTNVARIFAVEQQASGAFFICMEYVQGPGLRELLDKNPNGLPVDYAISLVRGIAQGLRAAHGVSLVHRDIKPENILLSADAQHGSVPKIVDFGIVAWLDEKNRTSVTHRPILTPQYASPEQFLGVIPAVELDGRTDLYALGVVFFEMLTGRLPFDSQAGGRSTYEQWLNLHCTAQPLRPSSLRPELADWLGLDELVLSLLAKEREKRPKNAAEVINQLDKLRYLPAEQQQARTVEDESVHTNTTADEAAARLVPDPPEETAEDQGDSEQFAPSTAKPRIAKMVLWAFLLVVVVGLVGIIVQSGSYEPPRPQPVAQSAYEQGMSAWDIEDYTSAASLFSQACDDDQYQYQYLACERLADLYGTGQGVPKDAGRWESLYLKACGVGDKEQCSDMGYKFANPTQGKPNYQLASEFYDKACSNGVGMACNNLGVQYDNGHGVKRDHARAAALYSKACDSGVALGCSNLGVLYENGEGVAQDVAKAVSLYQKGCDSEDGEGCSNLGWNYFYGKGVTEDKAKGLELMKKGCDMGNTWGCDQLKEASKAQGASGG